jgi:uncharacterized protein (TIGR04255 family)
MAQPRHLLHAPIREGLISIQFDPVSMEAVKEFSDAIASQYDNVLDIWSHAFELEVGQTALTKNERNATGRRFDTPKQGQPHVVLAQRGELTYSRLQPYGDWQDLRGAAKPLWELFARICKPQRVNRVAVRYINSMPLPLKPGEDFSKYLEASPQIPPELPQAVTAFLQRVVIKDPKTGNLAIVTQALEGAESTGSSDITVILDIDVSRRTQISPEDEAIWTILDTLRDLKNEIFFRHLTEDAVELFA